MRHFFYNVLYDIFLLLSVQAVSLYEYKPNRADELALQPNDVVTVLYEDSHEWWMGELEDGRQGYFPANYVMEIGKYLLSLLFFICDKNEKDVVGQGN